MKPLMSSIISRILSAKLMTIWNASWSISGSEKLCLKMKSPIKMSRLDSCRIECFEVPKVQVSAIFRMTLWEVT